MAGADIYPLSGELQITTEGNLKAAFTGANGATYLATGEIEFTQPGTKIPVTARVTISSEIQTEPSGATQVRGNIQRDLIFFALDRNETINGEGRTTLNTVPKPFIGSWVWSKSTK